MSRKQSRETQSKTHAHPPSMVTEKIVEWTPTILFNPIESSKLIQSLCQSNLKSAFTCLEDALSLKVFNAPTDANSSVYHRKYEDDTFRISILKEYLFEALIFGFNEGLNERQLVIWMSILKKTHDLYINSVKTKKDGVLKALDIFKRELQGYLGYKKQMHAVFTEHDVKILLNYFTTSYAQHVRLIGFTFSKSQKLSYYKTKKIILDPTPLQPLEDAIPEEKWEDWLKQEETRIKNEEEQEILRLQKIKQQEEEQARLVLAAEDLKREQQRLEMAESILRAPLTETDIHSPISEIQMKQTLESQEFGDNLENLSKTISTLVSQTIQAFETFLDSKLESTSNAYNTKLDQLKNVLESRDSVSKKSEILRKK